MRSYDNNIKYFQFLVHENIDSSELLERVFESFTLPQKLIDRYCLPWHTPAMERDFSLIILMYFRKVKILLK
jgi:hypothetical protein